MNYQFKFFHYQRKFKIPLETHHGPWSVREGIILKLIKNEQQIGWGEIAPLPWFGSETFVLEKPNGLLNHWQLHCANRR